MKLAGPFLKVGRCRGCCWAYAVHTERRKKSPCFSENSTELSISPDKATWEVSADIIFFRSLEEPDSFSAKNMVALNRTDAFSSGMVGVLYVCVVCVLCVVCVFVYVCV